MKNKMSKNYNPDWIDNSVLCESLKNIPPPNLRQFKYLFQQYRLENEPAPVTDGEN